MTHAYTALRAWADDQLTQRRSSGRARILVGLGTCGVAAGGQAVLEAVHKTIAEHMLEADVVQVGCIGMCFKEPLVDIILPGGPRLSYGPVGLSDVHEILVNVLLHNEHRHSRALAVIGDEPYDGLPAWKSLPFFAPQERTVLRNCGFIDPERLEEYVARDGYAGLVRAVGEMTPAQVIEELRRAGLRGRGGAGFPTAAKWEIAATHIARQRSTDAQAGASLKDYGYVICNADEGDPGAFMNRSVLEGDPHSVIEGMAIAGYAIGAGHGYIYCRAEYPLAIKRLKIALQRAREMHLLGTSILGSGFSFDISLKEGAGAFVCGEETALIASIEGRRGMPQPRPPYPAQAGLHGMPTIINNVETLNNVPVVIHRGAEWWSSRGTEKSRGTKTFALTGKVQNTSLIEIGFGKTLREVIYDIGGGIVGGRRFKAAQTGGPSGGCLAEQHLDLPIDYDSLAGVGAIMGSGGLVVMDEGTCMVDIARFFLAFTQTESCGKCVPCRIGTKRMLEILQRIVAGHGESADLVQLQELAESVRRSSLCGLGQTAPNPVLTTLKYFHHEYEAHILERRCPAAVCKALITYSIDPDRCEGCLICLRACPGAAISGAKREVHVIDASLCTRCDTCRQVCKFDAVIVR